MLLSIPAVVSHLGLNDVSVAPVEQEAGHGY